jgi:hypothetical protein
MSLHAQIIYRDLFYLRCPASLVARRSAACLDERRDDRGGKGEITECSLQTHSIPFSGGEGMTHASSQMRMIQLFPRGSHFGRLAAEI